MGAFEVFKTLAPRRYSRCGEGIKNSIPPNAVYEKYNKIMMKLFCS
jgi:hypothetical protein